MQIADQTKKIQANHSFSTRGFFLLEKEVDHYHEKWPARQAMLYLHELNNPVWEKKRKESEIFPPDKKADIQAH